MLSAIPPSRQHEGRFQVGVCDGDVLHAAVLGEPLGEQCFGFVRMREHVAVGPLGVRDRTQAVLKALEAGIL